MDDTTQPKSSSNQRKSQDAAGAPEVQLTPAMIEAGALVLAGYDTTFAGADLWAKRVFLAMAAAAPVSVGAARRNSLRQELMAE